MADDGPRPEEEVKKEVALRLKDIERLKKEAEDKGWQFASLDESELTKKARRQTARSPYIYSEGWSGGTPGGSAYATVYFSNPDPINQIVFATLFFGLANFSPDIQLGWNGRDTRWPSFSGKPPYNVAAGAAGSQSFSYVVPAGVPLGTYLGNVVLWGGTFIDQGTYFDRSMFDVVVR